MGFWRIGIDFVIDFGIVMVLVYVKGKGVILKEFFVVVINKNNNNLLVIGEEVWKMIGRILGNIVVVWLLRDGVILDYDII